MTEKQAWLKLAKEHADMSFPVDKGLGAICLDINAFIHCRDISYNIKKRMFKKIDDCIEEGHVFFNPDSDLLRADFCRLMYYIMGGQKWT